MEDSFQLITAKEHISFELLFNEKKSQHNRISFTDFSTIFRNIKRLNSTIVHNVLDNIKKDIAAKVNIENESKIMITKADYFKYINLFIKENNRQMNIKDEEFLDLFKLLTTDKETISKQNLHEILLAYDIPIEYNIFYAYVDKREELTFEDFCSLFKPNGKQELFQKTLTSGFYNIDNDYLKKNKNEIFPIYICK